MKRANLKRREGEGKVSLGERPRWDGLKKGGKKSLILGTLSGEGKKKAVPDVRTQLQKKGNDLDKEKGRERSLRTD